MKFIKENRTRTEKRLANKRHSPTLTKLLTKASIVLETVSEKDRKKALEEIDKEWKQYCKKYYERNKTEFPNVHAFAISINNHLSKLEKEKKESNMKIVK